MAPEGYDSLRCWCRHDASTTAHDDDAGDAVPEPHVCACQPASYVPRPTPQRQGGAYSLNSHLVPTAI